MKLTDKRQLSNLIVDYKLWIAFLEQFLEDHQISNQSIQNQLNVVKKQLTLLMQTNNIPIIIDQILVIDDQLKSIQSQVPQLIFQPA